MADQARTSSAKARSWRIRIPIQVFYGEGEHEDRRVLGAPTSLGLAVRAETATQAAEKVLDALQRGVDDDR